MAAPAGASFAPAGLGRGPRERNRDMALLPFVRMLLARWRAGPRRTPRRPRLALLSLEGREVPAAGGGFTGGGLLGEYYANAHLAGTPSFTRRDVRIDFDWRAQG